MFSDFIIVSLILFTAYLFHIAFTLSISSSFILIILLICFWLSLSKILASRNTNFLFQKEVAHKPLITNTKVSSKKVTHTHAISNTPPNTPNTITKDKSTNQDKNTNHIYKTYPCEVSDKLFIPKQQITNNIHSTTKQTLMTINNSHEVFLKLNRERERVSEREI